jgi:hypothetical protein
MSSKNNPERRGRVTELRKFNGEECVPVLLVDPENNMRFMAAALKSNGNLVSGHDGKPVPYQSL